MFGWTIFIVLMILVAIIGGVRANSAEGETEVLNEPLSGSHVPLCYGFDEEDFPDVNVDGMPMVAGIDLNGRPYGVTDTWIENQWLGRDGSLDLWNNPINEQLEDVGRTKPLANIDGSPMIDDLDIHGNPYGVTSKTWEL